MNRDDPEGTLKLLSLGRAHHTRSALGDSSRYRLWHIG